MIADLITYYTWLFGVSEEEITKEKEIDEKYRDGLAKLKEAEAQQKTVGFHRFKMEIEVGSHFVLW